MHDYYDDPPEPDELPSREDVADLAPRRPFTNAGTTPCPYCGWLVTAPCDGSCLVA